ncbi:MAG: molybdate ABC transporter permease subunit [Nannocystaceae bacterium]|nr:molybdate ABC transporter permease subunit [Nannocystaceae bacterium]
MLGLDPSAATLADPIATSLAVASWATVIALPPAIALGWLLARREFFGKALVSALLFAPMVLPPVVTGLLLLRLLGRHGPLGPALAQLGLSIPFSFAAAVVAATVVGLPLLVMSVRAAFAAVDPRYDALAATLGDGAWARFRRVVLPLSWPGIVGGAVLMFARALGEFGATIMLAGDSDDARTIAIAIYALFDDPRQQPEVARLAGASVLLSLVALVAYERFVRWQRRRLEWDDGA